MFEMSHDTIIEVDKYAKYINEEPEVYVDIDLITQDLDTLEAEYQSRVLQMRDMFYSVVGFIPQELTKFVILKYFDALYVPEEYTTKKDKSDSIAIPVLKKLIEDNYCVDFCKMQIDRSQRKSYLSKVRKLIEFANNSTYIQGLNNEKLVRIPYEVTRISNCRYSTANQNVIGFYGTLRTSMRAKPGYLLIGADFPQIDGKGALNLYFKTKLMQEISNTTDDSYQVFRELIRHTYNLWDKHNLDLDLKSKEFIDTKELEQRVSKFDTSIQTFRNKEERDMYKVIALRTVYNSQSSPFREINKVIKRVHNALRVTGRYRLVYEMVEYFRAIGYPIVALSRWGNSTIITEPTTFRVLSKVFNTPIQVTSSEIIITFTNKIMDYFRDLNLNKDDIKIYLNRHDEPILEIRENLFWEHAQFFKDMSHILIHGWKNFKIKWNIGPCYGDSDNQYTRYLDSLPYDTTKWLENTKEHINDPEPLPLDIPEIVALSYRVSPNGDILIVFTRQIGDYPMDEYYFKKYRDTRQVEYCLLRGSLEQETMDEKSVLQIISEALRGLPTDKTFIVNIENGQKARMYTIGDYSVYTCGFKHPLHEINNVILGSLMVKNYPELATDSDIYYNKYTDYYSSRLVRRNV